MLIYGCTVRKCLIRKVVIFRLHLGEKRFPHFLIKRTSGKLNVRNECSNFEMSYWSGRDPPKIFERHSSYVSALREFAVPGRRGLRRLMSSILHRISDGRSRSSAHRHLFTSLLPRSTFILCNCRPTCFPSSGPLHRTIAAAPSWEAPYRCRNRVPVLPHPTRRVP